MTDVFRLTRAFGRTTVAASAFQAGAILLLLSTPAEAAITKGKVVIRLEPVATGLVSPDHATHAGDGTHRLFIVDQAGRVRIVKNGALLPTPFLDLTVQIPVLSPGFDERGLLGLAFHPDYANNGRFFVRYSAPRAGSPGEPCFGTSRGCHEEILAEFSVSADPDVANPAGTILFRIDEPQFNHNAGTLAFGPDGYLYFTLGDGGGAHDGLADTPPSHGPIGNGQNIDTALGKMLRIDVDAGAPFGIPPDNPFVGVPGLDLIYAYGLRNPFRFAFDSRPGGDGRLILADVGQNLFEEVDIIVKGGNYGWVIKEGFSCFDPFSPNTPPATCAGTGHLGEPLIDPIVDYSHAEGGISVIGGYVYRGARSPGLTGIYVFGDFSASFGTPGGRLYFVEDLAPGAAIREFRIGPEDRTYGRYLKGFGEDEAGEVYALGSTVLGPTGTTGIVERIVAIPRPDLDVRPGACPNPFNPRGQGKLPVALIGTEGFDVARVDLASLALGRADAVPGGTVTPVQAVIEDVGSPFEGDLCGCHEAGGDGIPDLLLKFDDGAVASALGLSAGTAEAVPVRLSGRLSPHAGGGQSIYRFSMDGSQEPGGSGSAGTGECTVILNQISGSVSVSCTYQGLTGNAINAHIHGLAPPGVNAGVIVPLSQTGGTSGVITGGRVLSPALVQGMLDGFTYVNLHSTVNPGGEIRGQIAGGEPFSAEDCLVTLRTLRSMGPPIQTEPVPVTPVLAPAP
jgi:glucose/arabinose dehydrogenase